MPFAIAARRVVGKRTLGGGWTATRCLPLHPLPLPPRPQDEAAKPRTPLPTASSRSTPPRSTPTPTPEPHSPSAPCYPQDKEAASRRSWLRTSAGLSSLRQLHAWLHATHLCYAVGRQAEFGVQTITDPKLLASY